MSQSLRAVTLDAAGTLIAVAEPVGTTYARLAGAHGIVVEAAALEQGFRAAFASAPPLAFPGASPSRLRDHERAWWYTVVRTAFGRAAAAPRFDAYFDALFAHYARADAWRTFPDVLDALRRLLATGLRLAVVSNFDARLPALLDGLGVATLVDHIAYSSHAGAAKPDVAIFHAALHALGVAPAEALHVGDDPHADVGGARAAGMRAFLIDRTGRAADGDALRSLDQLPARLAGSTP